MESTEKKFIAHAENCLGIIDQAAREMSVTGVGVVAYIPGDSTASWISKMKVTGTLDNGSANFLAIAYSKAAEMAESYKISGAADRDPMLGEFGYQGGVIRKIDSGYLLAVFSGATGEQDAELAGKGLDCLLKAMSE
ncbi:MAG: hypothetical protein V2B15_19495 [Bacteroidota bacterium]